MPISFIDNRLSITFDDSQGQLDILDIADFSADATKAAIYFNGNQPVSKKSDADRVLAFTTPADIDPAYLVKYLTAKKLPANQSKIIADYLESLAPILDKLGYQFQASEVADASVKKAAPAKAQHRFSKAVSTIPFFVDHDSAKAEVYWAKRNEMIIKKGAILKKEMPLNKDGSVGFAQKFAMTLRDEQASAIGPDFVTTTDITLKSVNEVGHLLYFAGTNSWLVLKDETGRTIDDYTVVK
ncbi:hypothetical protein [Pseudolactococcus insecticola]|uniref:Uncharacterized protein n=1 Tax=Pseudolactococcus insecticola TaxID=2709158 RepID=A0A6A0B341_9LACT|nr:hypothetical protein [Lactococcus insecticola]GFH39749.1 hypothetical protein Hs20B_01470 [Lactococcus insecticola]